MDEANFDPGAETRFLCQIFKIPLPFSDRVAAWEDWGKVIDNNLALNVGLTTPRALELLNEPGVLDGKNVVVGEVHIGGYAYERINDHACKVTFLSCLDAKGNLPHWIVNKVTERVSTEAFTKYTKQFGRSLRTAVDK